MNWAFLAKQAKPNSAVIWLALICLSSLLLLIIVPLLSLFLRSFVTEGSSAWRDVLMGTVAQGILWKPLANSLMLAAIVIPITLLLGGFLACLVNLSDVPARSGLSFLAALPFSLPTFALVLAWQALFRNQRVGAQVGLLQSWGLEIPDLLAWGIVPVATVLIIKYSALSFMLIASALANLDSHLLEAALLSRARPLRVIWGIALPAVLPSMVTSAVLCFAETLGNFAAPALLGLPVRFYTLSTRLYSMIFMGQEARAYVLTILLILSSAIPLWLAQQCMHKRSYVTLASSSQWRVCFRLKQWRWPLFIVALLSCLLSSVLPLLVLLVSSFSWPTGGFSSHFWLGQGIASIADGEPGILRHPQFFKALKLTLWLGFWVALLSTMLGFFTGYSMVRLKGSWLATALYQLSLLPLLLPSLALGATLMLVFSHAILVFPALYGSFALLVIAGVLFNLPFTIQAASSAIRQLAPELEEAASLTQSSFLQRLLLIVLPLVARSLVAAGLFGFVRLIRELNLFVLLYTPATPLLSVLAFHYASQGFWQYANALAVVMTLASILLSFLAQSLQKTLTPWATN